MKSESGFTLVEALATGVLSTIVAGTLVSVLDMVNTQIKEGEMESRLGLWQSVVSEQIRSSVRQSWGILQQGDPTGFDLHYDKLPAVDHMLSPEDLMPEILICDKDGIPMAKYHVNSEGILEEWQSGDEGSYHPFTIGDQIVHVDPDQSNFSVAKGRKYLSFKLAYVLEGEKLLAIQEAIQCRNLSN